MLDLTACLLADIRYHDKFHRRCRYLRDRNRCGRRGRQVDDPLTVWSGERNVKEDIFILYLRLSGFDLYTMYKNTASQHRPGTSDPLGAAFADEEAIAGTSHVPEISLLCQYLDQSSIMIPKKSYFLPGGAFLIGVASLHELHFTTCWSFLPEMSIIA